MRKIGILALMVALLTGVAVSQTVIQGPGTTRLFNTPYTGVQTIVRDSNANLYVIYRWQVSTVVAQYGINIARSTDNGATWNMTWQTGFATLGASDYGSHSPCIAIDSKDNLHCAWMHRGTGSYSEPHYNRFDATTQKWGTEWVVVPPTRAMVNCILAVDSKDYVWFSHGYNSWLSRLEKSNLPFASDGKFTVFSPAPSSQGQRSCVTVDKNDCIHVSYYHTSPSVGVHHQWIDPSAATPKWTYTKLSANGATNIVARADYTSRLCADFAGNVFAIYNVDDQAPISSRQTDTETYVRKWDGGTQTWGTPVLVHGVAWNVYQYSGLNNDGRFISCCCDEASGAMYIVYRDFTSGDFKVKCWGGDDTETPATYAWLMNTSPLPANTQNYFFIPHFRGTLWPKQNRTFWGLHLCYVAGDQSGAKIYTDYFESFPIGSLSSTGTPRVGTTYKLDLAAVQDGSKSYATALCVSGYGTTIKVDRRFIPLLPDIFFYLTVGNSIPSVFQNFHGVLNASGTAQASLVIPGAASLVGVKAYTEFVTYPGGPKGIHTISNPFSFTLVP